MIHDRDPRRHGLQRHGLAFTSFLLVSTLGLRAAWEPAFGAAPVSPRREPGAATRAGVAESAVSLRRINELHPDGAWDLATGLITLDLTPFREVDKAYSELGYAPDGLWLEVDGERWIRLDPAIIRGAGKAEASFDAGKVRRQLDVRVVLKKRGREIFVSEPRLFEDLAFPRVSPVSLAGTPLPDATFPAWLSRKMGLDTSPGSIDLIREAAEDQRGIIQVTLNPSSRNQELIRAFRDHGAKLRIDAVLARDTGEISGWNVTDTLSGKRIPAAFEDLWYFANAAFNSNIFRWDGDAANSSFRFSHPLLARSWPRYIIAVQKRQGNGLVTRENRSSNLLPFQREYSVKLGPHGPVTSPNGDIFNPPLTGLALRDLYRWDPDGYGPGTLREMVHSLRWEREWLARERGVPGHGHRILGFTWTNLGSGRDNAPRCLGERGCLGVDLITYYKMMLDQESEFLSILGDWAGSREAARQAAEIGKVIDREYWNDKLGIYTDIIKKDADQVRRSDIRTMAGFWPLLARVPDASRIHRMIAENLHDPRRFGDGPYPPSTAADHAGQSDARGPLFDWAGRYWRGGGWPIDWTMLKKGLRLNGLRSEEAAQQDRLLAGLTEASDAYRKGDSPAFLNTGKNPPEELERMRKHGVFWEALGRIPDPKLGRMRVTFNRERAEDGKWHQTRENLGWSLATPLETFEDRLGFEGVPRFAGAEKDLGIWIHRLLTDPSFSYQQVKYIPALKPALDYLEEHPFATPADFAAFLRREASRSTALADQLRMIRRGYLEISPTFDPGPYEPGTGKGNDRTAVRNLPFQGTRFNLWMSRLPDGRIRLETESPSPFLVQFNQNWKGEGEHSVPLDAPAASSPVVEVGGPGHREVTLRLLDNAPAGARPQRSPSPAGLSE